MTHLDPELLAGFAIDGESPAEEHRRHLEECAECAATLTELQDLVGHGRELTEADDPVPVGPSVWAAIRDQFEPTQSEPTQSPVVDVRDRAPRRPGRWTTILIAAIVGVLVGAIGLAAIRAVNPPEVRVEAEAPLTPLPGKSGSGRAELLRADGEERLRVDLTGLPAPAEADLEVWLINTDGKRMTSLGSLRDAAGGTLPVPGWLIPAGYRIVDVSVEPRDGDPLHSGDSEVRGTLPG